MFATSPLVLPRIPLSTAFAPVSVSTPVSSFPSRHGCQNHSSDGSLYARPLRSVPLRALGRSDGAVETATAAPATVSVHNDMSPDCTAFEIRARNRIGLLQVITRVFRVLSLRIEKATVEFDGEFFVKRFFVVDSNGSKIEDAESLERIRGALLEAVGVEQVERADGGIPLAVRAAASVGPVVRRGPLLSESAKGRAKAETMFALMDGFLKNDPRSLQKDILHHVEYTVARSRFNFDDFEAYQALSHSVKDRLIERWHDTQQYFKRKNPKRLYFLSLEFLMGRSLSNSVINLGIRDQYGDALNQLGFELEVVAEQEHIEKLRFALYLCILEGGTMEAVSPVLGVELVSTEGDAALGNGGLARLSACQMDSLATMNFPACGYGLRYQYGLFRQVILDGFQHEQPDYWLNFGNPWEIERVHVSYPVKVEAVAYDNPIPGYGTRNTINLRLWAAKPSDQYDMEAFNTGDYINAVINRQRAETISNVLYPDDRSYQGLFYALDLGGTNFRVLRVQLGGKNDRVIDTEFQQLSIPQELMFGTTEELFDFIASELGRFVKKEGERYLPQERKREIGFTFSFPVKQTSVDSGILIKWTKGFAVTGTAGRDVVACLNEAMERQGLNIRVTALVNDAVATLAGAHYWDDDVMVAVILGTGTNACYIEHTDVIPKLQGPKPSSGRMIINTEWGAFSSGLPLTEFDKDMDSASINPGEQIFEKTISGMYLGEIVRRILLKMADATALFGASVPEKLCIPFIVSTPNLCAMQQDESDDLLTVGSILNDVVGVQSSLNERETVVEVCDTIVKRAGRLAGAGVVGILQKMEEDSKGLIFGKRTVVAMDGGLYEHYPQYRMYLQDAVTELLGPETSKNVVIDHTKDGSGIGAALLAAAHSKYAD